MRIFVTGATGVLGRAFVREALTREHALLCLVRGPDRDRDAPLDRVEIARGDLVDLPWDRIARFAPDAALHLAWIATPGEYLLSEANTSLLEQSRSMLAGLAERGVGHVAGVGSGIEYAPSDAPLVESSSPTCADSPYATAKNRLHEWLTEHPWPTGTTWSWLRVFHPYGPGEHPARITTQFLRTLASGEHVVLRTPDSVKDFVYVDDLARAFCDVLEARLAGAVNLGSGRGTSIRQVAEHCARLLSVGTDRVVDAGSVVDAHTPAVDPRPFVVADASRLRSTGWRPGVSMEEGLSRLARALGVA